MKWVDIVAKVSLQAQCMITHTDQQHMNTYSVCMCVCVLSSLRMWLYMDVLGAGGML